MARHFIGLMKVCFLLLCIPLLSSCGNKETVAALRIASSPWLGYEPLYLARDLGYLKEGVSVLELPSADVSLESFRNHYADMATLRLDEALELMSNGTKLRILFVMDSSNGADAVMARPGIRTLADLKGRRVAVENYPLGAYMLNRTLGAAGLKPKDIQAVPAPESRHLEMYNEGRADVFITLEPFKSQLAVKGAHSIYDSSQIPNEIFDVMVVHEDVFQARRKEVCEIVRQWYRTLSYMKQVPAVANSSIARRLGVSTEEYQSMSNGITIPAREENLRMLGGKLPAIMTAAGKMNEVMLKEGLLKRSVDIRQALDAGVEDCIAK